MDSITQGLLGGAVGQALFGHRYGNRAGWVAALGAMAPDLDVLIRSSTDPMLALEFHRHFTHAAVFVPFGGLIVAAFLLPLWRKHFSFKTAWFIAAVGYATHAPLDICTSYGTQYLWPFSNVRLAVDWVGIIDLFYSVPLLLGWVLAARRHRPRPAWVALALTTGYLLLGAWQHHRAVDAQAVLAHSRDHQVERFRVMPAPLSLLLWRGIYQYDGRYYADGIHVPILGEPVIYEGTSVTPVTAAAATADMRHGAPQHEDIYTFEWFTGHWMFVQPDDPLSIGDFRYSMLPNSGVALWGIKTAPESPDRHIERWNNRDRSSETISTFFKMMRGTPLD